MLLTRLFVMTLLGLAAFPMRGDAAEVLSLPALKGKSEMARIEEIQSWIQKRIPAFSSSAEGRSELETIQILYFLESHLETLKNISFKCKNRKKEMEESIERSLPRGAKPEELTQSHLKALNALFSSLCP